MPCGLDQPRHILGVVREVTVHLENVIRVPAQDVVEARDVGRTEPLFPSAVEDREPFPIGGEPVGELPGPVRRVVVDDEHADAERCERLDHALEVFALVVGRETDDA